MMKEKLGDKWTELQTNMTTGMTGIIETFKESFNPDKIMGAIQSAAGHTLKSCLPKSVADPIKMICAGNVC